MATRLFLPTTLSSLYQLDINKSQMRFRLKVFFVCGLLGITGHLLLQQYSTNNFLPFDAHQAAYILRLVPDKRSPPQEIKAVLSGSYNYGNPMERCSQYSANPVTQIDQVTFNQAELRQYESGLKKIYHNADLTNITDQYIERLKPLLPQSDLKGLGSCAVVFSSGSLKRFHHGSLIDTYDNVIRFNWAPVRGHEHHVGSKTTVLAGALHITRPVMQRARLAKGLYVQSRLVRHRGYLVRYDRKNVTMIVASTRHFDIRDLVFGDDCPEHCGERTNEDDWILRFPSDNIQKLANEILCAVTDEGRLWVSKSDIRIPTSGFVTVLMMMHACDTVSLFGVAFDEGADSYHYWEDSKVFPEVAHWFAMEHALYQWWHNNSLLHLIS